ncbi:MAG: trypsin-like peptidase domain-containing protein [Vicinamibacteraceae bacterium]|nr:trypsin-like peptidase domain-containing protein [Vicinamibacteraceae bacterium]
MSGARASLRALRTGTLAACLAAAAVLPADAQPVSRRLAAQLNDLSDAFEQLAARVGPSVVQVVVTGYGEVDIDAENTGGLLTLQRTGGSGVIVSADGYIVTNAHVVEGARRIKVSLPPPPVAARDRRSILKPRGRTVGARIVGLDRETDLAVLKVDETGLVAMPFGDSDSLRQGQLVFAFGSPLGLENSMTMGVLSAIGRQREADDPMVYLQTDAPINPGSSGGPLVDAEGRLMGINTYILSSSGGNEGIGFAAPSNIVRSVFEQIRAGGRMRRGTIGVFPQTITPTMAEGLTLARDTGVVLGDVYPGGPGEAAGLEPGDIVLTLDGRPMENGRQLEVNLYGRRVGDHVTLQIQRGNDLKTVPVQILEREDDPERFAELVSPEENLIARLGILGVEVDAKVRELLPPLRRSGGVLVAARAADAPVLDQSLRAGDIITAVNGTLIAGLADLREALGGIGPGGACVLHVQRGEQLLFITLELD